MHIHGFLAIPVLFGLMPLAVAIPTGQSVDGGIHYRHGQQRHQAELAARASFPKLRRQSSNTSTAAADGPEFWLESIAHQGISPLGPSGHTIFRNVKDFGAKAISSGERCGEGCFSSTTTPAVVYFPAGTYVISAPIFDYYNTIITGNPSALPVLKASAGFEGGYLIDGNPYFGPALNWPATTVFWRQVRNLVLDTTDVAAGTQISGIHWPTAQATSLQNLVFKLNAEDGTEHQGIFCENGSSGFAGDLVFNGGKIAAALGNQQFTMRNLHTRKRSCGKRRHSRRGARWCGSGGWLRSFCYAGWGQGNQYVAAGPTRFAGDITAVSRPAGLLDGEKYYQRSKPRYESLPVSAFSSVREGGVARDRTTDDTDALQNVIDAAAASDKFVFFDAGIYKVTKTLNIPANSRIVGEAFPVIVSSGHLYAHARHPLSFKSVHGEHLALDVDGGQITLYSGRGLNIESTAGNIWLSGTSVEHNVLYEYQFVSTKNVYMGQIQTETAYYQSNPNALIPFAPNPSIHDPNFASSCDGNTGNCAVGWGFRVVDSQGLAVYGGGLYSFDNYDAECSTYGGSQDCQNSIFSIEGDSSITVYNLNTLGSLSMPVATSPHYCHAHTLLESKTGA
ncbi:pectate lyase superfamily protein-domain-containing protein [Aspergillus terricola var. indicus]